MRRLLAAIASLGLAAGTIALATPVHADPSDAQLTCNTNPPFGQSFNEVVSAGANASWTLPSGTSCDEVSLRINQGGLSIVATRTRGGVDTNIPDGGYVQAVSVQQGDTVSITGFADGDDVVLSFWASGGTPDEIYFTVGGGGGGTSGSSGAAGSAPAPVMQQFGMPASGNCEDGYSDSMDWSGVGSGGWGVSWAQWMNDGSGGVVCSRTVMYDTSTAKWVVN